ncbi:MAG: hypothetical protein AUG91_06660 [Actinobacteria bacterium 13_1_20CM_4_69_9]|nr:MAG: hypothetical protein AUG91_06660 [Actinobacteria bacterium 13_1_20CM_4_69_9]
MQQRRHTYALPLDQRRRAAAAERDQVERPALDVRIGLELRQPVRQLQRRIAEGAGEGVAQIRRTEVRSELDDEAGERGPRQPCLQQADQEHHRRQRERDEGRPADLSDPGPTVRGREEQEGEHQQPDPERVDEQRK